MDEINDYKEILKRIKVFIKTITIIALSHYTIITCMFTVDVF